MRYGADVQREGAVARPGVETHEDERPDARCEKSRHEDHAQERTTNPGRLHEQECAEDRRPEQRRDGREAACRPDHHHSHLRGVLLDEAHGQYPEPAADGDERCLGTEDGSEAQRRQ